VAVDCLTMTKFSSRNNKTAGQIAFLGGLFLFFIVVSALFGDFESGSLLGNAFLRTGVFGAKKELSLTPVEVGTSALTKNLREEISDSSGEVLGVKGDENDPCRDSPCGGEECTVDGLGEHLLGGDDGSTMVNFKGSNGTRELKLSVKKISYDNQVTAGVRSDSNPLPDADLNDPATLYYPIEVMDDGYFFSYPNQANALDIYTARLSPLQVSEDYKDVAKAMGIFNIHNLMQEGACYEDYKSDSGPFAVHVKVLVGGADKVTFEDQPVAIMQNWLSFGKDINPDRANKLAQILLMMDKSPIEVALGAGSTTVGVYSEELKEHYEREGNSGNVMKKTGEGKPMIVDLRGPTDNYIASIGGVDCNGKRPDISYEGEVSYGDDEKLRKCNAGNLDENINCEKEFPVILEVSAATGSNYSCEAGHCLDMFYDNEIASLMSPGELTGALTSSLSQLVDREATAMHAAENSRKGSSDAYIRDMYSVTNCSVDVAGGTSTSVPCIHTGPNYVQGHYLLSSLTMNPYEVQGITGKELSSNESTSKSLDKDFSDIFWNAIIHYWLNQGDSCKESQSAANGS